MSASLNCCRPLAVSTSASGSSSQISVCVCVDCVQTSIYFCYAFSFTERYLKETECHGGKKSSVVNLM